MTEESDVHAWVVALVDGYRVGGGVARLEELAYIDDAENALLITVDAFLVTISSARVREIISRFDANEDAANLASWTHGVAAGRSGIEDLSIREWSGVISLAAGNLNSWVPTDIRRRIALFATLLSIFTEGGTSVLMSYDRLQQEGMKLSNEARLHLEQER